MPTLEPTSEDTRVYECAILYPYPLSQKEEQVALKEVEGFFQEAGAVQIAKDPWGRRGLAYPIKGSMEATVVVYYYEMDPSKLKEIDQAMRISKNVLRHLIIKPPKGYQILKYGEKYDEWMKNRETVEEVRVREKEEKVKAQVAEKAKRQVAKTNERKTTDVKEVMVEEEVTEKLDKLISDDSLDI